MKAIAEDQDQIKADQDSMTGVPSGGRDDHTRHMRRTAPQHRTSPARRSPATRVAWWLGGAAIGALAGAALAAPFASALSPSASSEQAGYGGTATSLHITVSGEQLLVSGMGYAAGAVVEVQVGDLTTHVTADEFGEVHAVLLGADASAPAIAVGTGADGRPLTLDGTPRTGGGNNTGGAVVGASVGSLAAVFVGRRKVVL
jgi:hypothetical protein